MLRILAFATLLTTAACASDNAITPEKVAQFEAAMERADPEAMQLDRSCMPATGSTVFTVGLTDETFDGRFIYIKRTGLENGYLVEFANECRNIRRGVPPQVGSVCRGSIVDVRGERCFVDRIFSVPDETVGRAVAFKRTLRMIPLGVQADAPMEEIVAAAEAKLEEISSQ